MSRRQDGPAWSRATHEEGDSS